MPANKPPSDDLLARAAELRAGGLSWEAVAAKIGRAADTVRRWPTQYPDRWQAVLHAAERRLVSEAGAESVLVLRQLLRSDDGWRWIMLLRTSSWRRMVVRSIASRSSSVRRDVASRITTRVPRSVVARACSGAEVGGGAVSTSSSAIDRSIATWH